MGIFTKSEGSECCMSLGAALFAKTKLFFREKNTVTIFLEIITWDHLVYTMDTQELVTNP